MSMRKVWATAAAVVIVFGTAPPVAARVVTPAQVRYATQNGRSDWVKTEVTLMKGAELNTATRTFNYDAFSGYALVWFSQDQVAIIKLENTILGCGSEMDAQCIPHFGNLEGNDQGGRKWEICTSSFC